MPLPAPKKGESRDIFIGRCMSDENIKEDFPTQKQRLAVCFSQWASHKESKSLDVATMIFATQLLHDDLIRDTNLDDHGQGD